MTETSFSISRIAQAMKMDRATVAKKLAAAGAEPSGTRGGYPVYSLPAIVAALAGHGGKTDPSRMNPFELRAYYAAERDRLRLETERGDLMHRADVVTVVSQVATPITRELDTIPDRLERDLRVGDDVVDYVRAIIRSARENMVTTINGLRGQA